MVSRAYLQIKHHLPQDAPSVPDAVEVKTFFSEQRVHVNQERLQFSREDHGESSDQFGCKCEIKVGDHLDLDDVHVEVAIPKSRCQRNHMILTHRQHSGCSMREWGYKLRD